MFIAITFSAAGSLGAIEELNFETPDQEQRFHRLIDEMRCPMCLNANLSGSDAPIAADLRAEIYRQLQQGRSDREIIDFMKARYGDFIMYRPPLNPGTALLWFGPLVLLIAGFIVLRRMMVAARSNATDVALTIEEQSRLQELLTEAREPPRQ